VAHYQKIYRSYEVCCLYGFFVYHILLYSFDYILHHFIRILVVMYFYCYVHYFLLLCNVFFCWLMYSYCYVCSVLCTRIVSLCCSVYCFCVNVYWTTATGISGHFSTTLTEGFSSVVRQMPGYNSQSRGTARTSQFFFNCYVCSVLCILCTVGV
jgi:hypothetical protein